MFAMFAQFFTMLTNLFLAGSKLFVTFSEPSSSLHIRTTVALTLPVFLLFQRRRRRRCSHHQAGNQDPCLSSLPMPRLLLKLVQSGVTGAGQVRASWGQRTGSTKESNVKAQSSSRKQTNLTNS